jgi:hypothetical protein
VSRYRRLFGYTIFALVLSMIFGARMADAQASACPAGAVTLRPGDNLQALVDGRPAGTVYCLQDGTYSRGSIAVKDGDSYIAANAGRAIFDGANQIGQAFISTYAPGDARNAINVTLQGIVVQNYRSSNPFNSGAVDANVGWVIRNVTIQNNDSGLFFANMNWDCSQGAVLDNSLIQNNRYVGMFWNGTRATFSNNRFISNGWSSSATDAHWYGSIKVTNQGRWNSSFNAFVGCPTGANERILVTGNTSIYNRAAGWWNDINVSNIEISNNTFIGNERWGVFHEISSTALIANNTFRCNRSTYAGDGFWDGADINVIDSSNTTIRGNNVTVCGGGQTFQVNGVNQTVRQPGRGILLLSEYRAPLANNRVEGNTVRTEGTVGWLAGVGFYGGQQSNNVFTQNTYVTSASSRMWNWWDNLRTFAEWQQGGLDQNSTASTSGAQPTVAPPTAVPPTTVPPTPTRIPPTVPGPTAVPPTQAPGTGPYFGAPLPVPGRIQAEDYDRGANGTAYRDNSPGMAGGSVYRNDTTDVDLKQNTYGSFTLGWFETNEWTSYTVSVAQAGRYDITVAAGSVDANRTLQILFNGQNLPGNITVPTVPNWDTLATVTVRGVQLNAGVQQMRLVSAQGFLDIDYVDIAPAAAQPTGVPPTTVPPTAVPPTATPVPPPVQPELRAVPQTSNALPGQQVRIDFRLELPGQLPGGGARALEAICTVTSTVASGVGVVPGTLFGPDPVIVNAGFQPNATFTFAASQSGSNPPVNTSGVVFSVTLNALAPGQATITCESLVVDGTRVERRLAYSPAIINIAAPTATAVPPTAVPPTGVPPTTVPPTVPPTATRVNPTPLPPPTVVPPTVAPPTATPTQAPPTATPAPQNGIVRGTVLRSSAPDNGITIQVLNSSGQVIATGTTNDSGAFEITNVPPGSYTIRAETPAHLPAEGALTVTAGQVTTKAQVILLAGDLVQTALPIIDELDVVQLAIAYGVSTQAGPPSGDLDINGRVGLGDLFAIAENLRKGGPIPWN